MTDPKATFIEIDAIGKPCPMPLLMLKRAIKSAPAQQKICLKASDPNSEIDILRYCQLQKRRCQMIKISEHELHYIIE
ncbi:sulfurtransferase TusA family protein [Acinetobacter sp. ANC 5383]